ncbi:MAG TPA: hypothetical protein VGP62_00330 [Bryobacteraceae bacterium]|nr:hypothetical protein [Bryobacteraceae bacterium]
MADCAFGTSAFARLIGRFHRHLAHGNGRRRHDANRDNLFALVFTVMESGATLAVPITCSSPPFTRAATAASEVRTKRTSKRAFMVFLLSVVVCFSRRILGRLPRPPPIRWIRLPLRIQRLHLIEFLIRDLRQIPDEQNQAPGFLGSVHSAEGWHAAQANSIFNCVAELTVALVLRPGRTQVGRFRIEAFAKNVWPPPSFEWHVAQ